MASKSEYKDTCGYSLDNYTLSQTNIIKEGIYEIVAEDNPYICGFMFTPSANDYSTNSYIFNVHYSSDTINWTYVNSNVFSAPLNFMWTNSGVYPDRALITPKMHVNRVRIQIKPDRNENYKILTSKMTVSLLKDVEQTPQLNKSNQSNHSNINNSELGNNIGLANNTEVDNSNYNEVIKNTEVAVANDQKKENEFGDLGSDSDFSLPAQNYHLLESDVRGESRANIQHPTDGRLVHLDAEDYDIEEPNNVIIDRSLMDSNGFLKKHATIKDEHWSCRHVIKLANVGDRVELQASKMIFVPKLKITVMAFVKVDQLEQVNPIFSVIGLRPDPFFNQLNLDILKDGSVRWKYVKQSSDIGYEAQTESEMITPNTWNHIAVTYKTVNFTSNGIASIYVNGTIKAKYHGSGYIPKDWEGLTMIGSDQHDHQFYGSIDEFVIFDRILSDDEIKSQSEKCVSDRYYSGGNVWSKSGTIMSPHYPALYKKPVSSHWKITGKPYEIIEVNIEEYIVGENNDEESCQRTTLILKETDSGQVIDKVCKLKEPHTYISRTNGVTILFETSGEPKGIKYKIHFRMLNNTITKRSTIATEDSCLFDKVFKNMRITWPSNQLKFVGPLSYYPSNTQIFECANKVCQANSTHNIAYAINGSCYGMDCGVNHQFCRVATTTNVDNNQIIEPPNEYLAIIKKITEQ